MRRAGEKMTIVREAVIYHKVASAAKRMENGRLGRDYMYYLGRLIVARLYYSPLQFWVIRCFSLRGCYKYFKADGLSAQAAFRLVRRLMHEACTKEDITYEDFVNYSKV